MKTTSYLIITGDYMKSRVGQLIEKEYFRNYPHKLWGISTDKMRADWAPKRIEIRDKILPFFMVNGAQLLNQVQDLFTTELLKKF